MSKSSKGPQVLHTDANARRTRIVTNQFKAGEEKKNTCIVQQSFLSPSSDHSSQLKPARKRRSLGSQNSGTRSEQKMREREDELTILKSSRMSASFSISSCSCRAVGICGRRERKRTTALGDQVSQGEAARSEEQGAPPREIHGKSSHASLVCYDRLASTDAIGRPSAIILPDEGKKRRLQIPSSALSFDRVETTVSDNGLCFGRQAYYVLVD
ncbi:hypothetical protein ACLOJK_000880 [Asimina triloba]